METLRKLPGFRDLLHGRRRSLSAAYDALDRFFSAHGYGVIDTPILEPTEMFLRKGGGEMAAQLYSFTDPGGNAVSLRPEFTSSIVRWRLENGGPDPLRAQYGGPVFRYGGRGERRRQFHQAGVELMGPDDPEADAEVISLACQGLSVLGLNGAKLALGDLSVYNRLTTRLGLSERARVFVLNNVRRLRDGAEGRREVDSLAAKFRLTGDGAQPALANIAGLKEAEARELLVRMMEQEDDGALGQRTPQEVADGLLRKARGAEDPSKMREALDVAARLASIKGPPREALAAAKALLDDRGAGGGMLDRMGRVVELLDAADLGGVSVTLDLGMARGIAYYTGVVFELFDANAASLGGGGRYDELARNMGSPVDLPALGFAYNMESLLSAGAKARPQAAAGLLMVPTSAAALSLARAAATKLLGQTGLSVELADGHETVEEAMRRAGERGFAAVLIFSEDGNIDIKDPRLG